MRFVQHCTVQLFVMLLLVLGSVQAEARWTTVYEDKNRQMRLMVALGEVQRDGAQRQFLYQRETYLRQYRATQRVFVSAEADCRRSRYKKLHVREQFDLPSSNVSPRDFRRVFGPTPKTSSGWESVGAGTPIKAILNIICQRESRQDRRQRG